MGNDSNNLEVTKIRLMIVMALCNLEVTLANDSDNFGVTSDSNNLAVTLQRLGTRYIKSPLGSHGGSARGVLDRTDIGL